MTPLIGASHSTRFGSPQPRPPDVSRFGFKLQFVRAPSSAESLDIGRQDTFRNPFRFDTSRNPLTPRRIDCGELHGSAVRTESGV